MVPETRLCAYCKSKIPPEKRADAKFCSHACKLSAHRKEERADAAHKESVAPMQELEHALLQNARPSAMGYRLGLEVESPKHGWVRYIYPSFVKVGVRFDGTEKVWPCFRLRPFEPPVIPMEGIYSVYFLDRTGMQTKGGQGVANGIRLTPFRYVANIKDGDRKRIRDRD